MSKKEEKEIDVDKLINEYECPYMLKQGIRHYFSKGHMVSGIDAEYFVDNSIDDTLYDIETAFKEL